MLHSTARGATFRSQTSTQRRCFDFGAEFPLNCSEITSRRILNYRFNLVLRNRVEVNRPPLEAKAQLCAGPHLELAAPLSLSLQAHT